MNQWELRLWMVFNIFLIGRENVFGLNLDADASNSIWLQSSPTSSEVLSELKTNDYIDIKTDITNNCDIKTIFNDVIGEYVTNHDNVDAEENAIGIRTIDKGNDSVLYVQTENESSEDQKEIENLNNNVTFVYIAGTDDSIVELKKNIQNYGKGHEMRVNFYLYKDDIYFDLGYLYTDADILRYFKPTCEKYFCVKNSNNDWCFDNLSKECNNEDILTESESLNIDNEVQNINEPAITESNDLSRLVEYKPFEIDGRYELNLAKENLQMDDDTSVDVPSNDLNVQNTNNNNFITILNSMLTPELVETLQPSQKEENKVINLNIETDDKANDNKDVSLLSEAVHIQDDTMNDFTFDDNYKQSVIDIDNSKNAKSVEQNGFTNNKENVYQNNLNYLNDKVPINTLINEKTNVNYLDRPCSLQIPVNDDNNKIAESTNNNYQSIQLIDSYDKDNPTQTESRHNLHSTSTRNYDKYVKANDDFNYQEVSPNMMFTPSDENGRKQIVYPTNMIIPLKWNNLLYQANLIPNLRAKTQGMGSMNTNTAGFDTRNMIIKNNIPILTRPEYELNNGFQRYNPPFVLENQVKPCPISYEESVLADNNIKNVQSPLAVTYLKMPSEYLANYETLGKFNVYQNKTPWYFKYTPGNANYIWQALSNKQKHFVYDDLKTQGYQDYFFNILPSRTIIAKSLKPYKYTSSYAIDANSKLNFLVPESEKISSYDTKIISPNKNDIDVTEQGQSFLNDINNGLSRTKYYIQDPCTYKNFKSLDSDEISFIPGTYNAPTTNYQNTKTVDTFPYRSDIAKESFNVNLYPYSTESYDKSQQGMYKKMRYNIPSIGTNINFNNIINKWKENILVPGTNPITKNYIQYLSNILPPYKQNYLEIPSESAKTTLTPLFFKTYQLNGKDSNQPPVKICHNYPYFYSKNVNQPFTYNPASKSIVTLNGQEKDMTPTIVKNIPTKSINGVPEDSLIRSSATVNVNNLITNPLLLEKEYLENSMYSVDSTLRNTGYVTKLPENKKQTINEVEPTKSIVSTTSYKSFYTPNVAQTSNPNHKFAILRDQPLNQNIIKIPAKNLYTYARTKNSIYPQNMKQTPLDIGLQKNIISVDFQTKQIPTYNLLQKYPDIENLSPYTDQTAQSEISGYNTIAQSRMRPDISQYMKYTKVPRQNVLPKLRNVMPISYFPLTATYSDIRQQNGQYSNFYTAKLKENFPEVYPNVSYLKTFKDIQEKRVKYSRAQNVNDFYNNNIQNRPKAFQMYPQPSQKIVNNDEMIATTDFPRKISSKMENVKGSTVLVEELNNKKQNLQIINYKEIPTGTILYDNINNNFNNPTVKIKTMVDTNPKFQKTDINIDKNEFITPIYPIYQYYDLREPNYIKIPSKSTKTPISSSNNYLQYSITPQKLLNIYSDSSISDLLPTASLLQVKPSTMRAFAPAQSKGFNSNVQNFQPSSTLTKGENAIIPNQNNFLLQFNHFLPTGNILPETTGYPSNTIPIENLQSTYLNIPYNYDISKDILQPIKQTTSDDFYTASLPAIKQEEMKRSSINENIIDLNYNDILNKQKAIIYSQPCMTNLNFKNGISKTVLTPKIYSINKILPKNSYTENNAPAEESLTVPSFYNPDGKLCSHVNTFRTDEIDEIMLKDIPELNQDSKVYGHIRYSRPEYQIIPNYLYQGQHHLFNNMPEIKQNYLEIPSKYDNLKYSSPSIPGTANIVPSSYSISLTPQPITEKSPLSVNNELYPFTVKPSLSQKNPVQQEVYQIATMSEPYTSKSTIYESLRSSVGLKGHQRIDLKQPPNIYGKSNYLYYNPLDFKRFKSSVNPSGNIDPNNEYSSDSTMKFNSIYTPDYVAQKETYNTGTTNGFYRYCNPTVRMNKYMNWPSKLENYVTPVEFYMEPKNSVNVPRDYTSINTQFRNLTTQTSEFLNPAIFVLSEQTSGNTSLINNFDWKFNLQSKEPFYTSQYWPYTKYPHVLNSRVGTIRPTANYYSPIPLNEDIASQRNNDIYFSNIPNKLTYISPNLADIVTPKQNTISSKLPNVVFDNNLPINQYKEYINEEVSRNQQVNSIIYKKGFDNTKQFPITPFMGQRKINNNVIDSKLFNSLPIKSTSSSVTDNLNSVSMQTAQSSYSIVPNSKYDSLNLYPKNIYSYLASNPQNDNFVYPSFGHNYFTTGLSNSPLSYSSISQNPEKMLQSTTKSVPTVKITEENPILNHLAARNSRINENDPILQYKPRLWSSPSIKVGLNPIKTINSFIPKSQNNFIPIISSSTKSSNRLNVPQTNNFNYNMITQNTGAFQSDAIPILPLNDCQTNMASIPIAESRLLLANEIPTIQPLLDFSSVNEPQSLISNKTSSEILKPNSDLPDREQIYFEQRKIPFIPGINSFDKQNIFPLHPFEPYSENIYPIYKHYSYKQPEVYTIRNRFENQNQYENIHFNSAIKNRKPYKSINPFLNAYADLNYSFNFKTNPTDFNNNFDEISSETQNLPTASYINPTASVTSQISNTETPSFNQIPNIYTNNWLSKYLESLNVQSDNTLLNSGNAKTLTYAGIKHNLLEPADFKTSTSFSNQNSQSLLSTNEVRKLSSNLNVAYQTPVTLTKPYLSTPIDLSSYTELNQPINKSMQFPNTKIDPLSNSDSEKYCEYFLPTKYSYRTSNSITLPVQPTFDFTKYKLLNSPPTSNVKAFQKPHIENFIQQYPFLNANLEGNDSIEPIHLPIYKSHLCHMNGNARYYQELPKIVIAKYDPSASNSLIIGTGNCNYDLKAWKSKLKIIAPTLLYKVKEMPSLNFMSVIKNPSCGTEDAIDFAKKFITKKYGVPTTIKGKYSFWKPYAYLKYDSNIRQDMPLIWPTFCTCGCRQSGCNCRNK